jgi:23S rRNA (pseudouridine1915-N3)-methyltransferase
MKITIIVIGTIKETYILSGIQEYLKRLKRFVDLEVKEIQEVLFKDDDSEKTREQKLHLEAEKIMKAVPNQAYTVAFDIGGTLLSSEELAQSIENFKDKGQHLCLIIGSSHGLHPRIKEKVHQRWSFSRLTFPHQLFRLMVMEQVYRAFTMIEGHPYHK